MASVGKTVKTRGVKRIDDVAKRIDATNRGRLSRTLEPRRVGAAMGGGTRQIQTKVVTLSTIGSRKLKGMM